MNKHKMIANGMMLSAGLFVFGCGTRAGPEIEAERSSGAMKNQCKVEYNKPSNPCRISVYEIIASPEKWSGLYLEFLAYAPANGVKLLFINKDASEFEDYQSSFLIVDGGESKIKREGYVLVSARFDNDRRDYGVASGTRNQIGTISEMAIKKYVVAMSRRREECVKDGCFVRHLDGG